MTNIYSEFYNLIISLFGGPGVVPFADSLCTIIASFCVIFVILIPFIIVYRVIKLFSR